MAKKSPALTGIKESTVKEKVLKKVRNALISKPVNPFKDVDFSSPVYADLQEEPVFQFVLNLKQAGGTFVYCENESSVAENLKILLNQKGWERVFVLDDNLADFLSSHSIPVSREYIASNDQPAGMTGCEFLVARFGSVIVSSALSSGRRMFAWPEAHIVVAGVSQVVPELKDALGGLKKKYSGKFPSQITAITGPSRTADIEKTLVMGAHGPRELYVFLVDNQ